MKSRQSNRNLIRLLRKQVTDRVATYTLLALESAFLFVPAPKDNVEMEMHTLTQGYQLTFINVDRYKKIIRLYIEECRHAGHTSTHIQLLFLFVKEIQ